MADQRRNIEKKVNELLGFFPVVIILGVRQCGKTTLARRLRPKWRYFDLERAKDFDFISRDFDFFVKEHPHSIVIDKAQRFPELFQELRSVIDRDRRRKNRFLLTGSSSLELIKNTDIIFCRNVFIYFDNNLQKQLLIKFYNALRPKGYLVMGKSETLIQEAKEIFEGIDLNARIYRRK